LSTYRERRRRIIGLAASYDNIVVIDPKNIFYMTDFWGGGIGIVRPDSTVLITSGMEERRARETGKEVEIVAVNGREEIEKAARRIIAKGKSLLDIYKKSMRGGAVDGELFTQARRAKDPDEVSRISDASRRIEKIYRMLESTIRPGVTEIALAAEAMKLATVECLTPLAAEGSLSPIIIGSGENAAFPHADLTERKIKTGDMVVADIFFRFRGYCSDCTRTYAVGRVSKERREGYQAVLEAQLQGIELVRSGASGRSVHEGVKKVLAGYGLDRYFTHGAGHGVGIDIHESPSLGGRSSDTLMTRDVVTVEPGIYIPGDYGVRIEDTLVLDGGTRNMFSYTKELQVL